MASDLDLIVEDLSAKFSNIRELSRSIENSTHITVAIGDGETETKEIRPLQRAGSGLGSYLLIYFAFEDCIRQMSSAYCRYFIERHILVNRYPYTMAASYWKKSVSLLSEFNEIKSRTKSLQTKIIMDDLSAFIFDQDLTKADNDRLTYHERNLRPSEINSIFKRYGIENIIRECCSNITIQNYAAETDEDRTYQSICSELNEIVERRNEIVHRIDFSRFPASGEVSAASGFLHLLAQVMAEKLSNRLDSI